MAYVLRFVQKYLPRDRAAFMELEAEFAALERKRTDFPKGRRLQPCSGARAGNTLVWESPFDSLADVDRALKALAADPQHTALFGKQAPYIVDAFTEIDEVLEL